MPFVSSLKIRRGCVLSAVILFFLLLMPRGIRAMEWDRNVVAVVEKARPAVVNIEAKSPIDKKLGPLSRIIHPDDTAGNRPRRWYTSVASGIIWNEDGYLVTTASVVKDAEVILVKTLDQREFKAKLIGMDEDSNLAVLKIRTPEGGKLPTVPHRTESLPEGSLLILLGYGFGGAPSIATGVAGMPPEKFDPARNWFQFTAPVRPGNSGSALIDIDGRLAGIVLGREEDMGFQAVLKILTQQNQPPAATSMSNYGIAISAAKAEPIITSLIKNGCIIRGWIGVSLRRCKPGTGVSGSPGLEIIRVVRGSPAERGGLKPGDRLLRFNTTSLTSPAQFGQLVRRTKPGTFVDIEFERSGDISTAHIEIGERPRRRQTLRNLPTPGETPSPMVIGLLLQDLTPALKTHFNIPGGLGVMIADVRSSTSAYRVGLRAGDILIAIDDTHIRNTDDAETHLAKHRFGDRIEFTVIRDGKRKVFPLILTRETSAPIRFKDQVKVLDTHQED